MSDINELRRKLGSDDLVDHIDIHANVKPVLTELLGRIEAAERDIAMKERIIDSLGSTLNAVADTRDALRARIEAMEQQDQIAIQLDIAKRAMLTSSLGLVDQAMTDHSHELRRHARKIAHPAGDVPAVMLAAADEIERLHGDLSVLRADFETAHARMMMTSAAVEREACAKVCDTMSSSDFLPHQCAAAIRARGEPDAT